MLVEHVLWGTLLIGCLCPAIHKIAQEHSTALSSLSSLHVPWQEKPVKLWLHHGLPSLLKLLWLLTRRCHDCSKLVVSRCLSRLNLHVTWCQYLLSCPYLSGRWASTQRRYYQSKIYLLCHLNSEWMFNSHSSLQVISWSPVSLSRLVYILTSLN